MKGFIPGFAMMADIAKQTHGLNCYPIPDTDGLYNLSYGLQDKTTFVAPLCREFRGMVMDSNTGQVVFRGFHKFFNLNEHEETMVNALKWENLVGIEVKMDGTMILVASYQDELLFKTKNSMTGPIVDIARKNAEGFEDFLMGCTEGGWTLIFEQVYDEHPENSDVVTSYKEPGLHYLCRRHNLTGQYDISYETREIMQKAGIQVLEDRFRPIVKDIANDLQCRTHFLRTIPHQVGIEGLILVFEDDDGNVEFVKIKTNDYLAKAKTLSNLSDRGVVDLIEANKFDDAMAFIMSRNNSNIAYRMEAVREKYFGLRENLKKLVETFVVGDRKGRELYEWLKDHPTGKDYAYLIQARVGGKHIDYDKFFRQNLYKTFSTEQWDRSSF